MKPISTPHRIDGVWHSFPKDSRSRYHLRWGGLAVSSSNVEHFRTEAELRNAILDRLQQISNLEQHYDRSIVEHVDDLKAQVQASSLPLELRVELESVRLFASAWEEKPTIRTGATQVSARVPIRELSDDIRQRPTRFPGRTDKMIADDT